LLDIRAAEEVMNLLRSADIPLELVDRRDQVWR
jgi:hypothetical protein